MPKDFLYYLTEEDGRSLSVVNGIVTATGQHTPLYNTPDGWQEISIAWERNMSKYYGLHRNFSLPLGFFFDAAFILRHELYTKNIERKIYLLIQQLELVYGPSTYKYLYKYLYKGELDFSTFKSDNDRVTLSIMEGGLSKQLKANENTVYDIPFDDDAIDILLDGIILSQKAKFLLLEQSMLGPNDTSLQFVFISNEGTAPGPAYFSIYEHEYFLNPDTSLNYFLTSIQDIAAVNISGTIKFSTPESDFDIKILTNTARTITLASNAGAAVSSVDVDITFDIFKDEKFFLVLSGNVFNTFFFAETEFIISLKSRYAATTIKAYKPFDLYKKLISKITGSADNAVSTLLELNSDKVVTCGDAIRGIAGATIKTSLSDFDEDCNVTCFTGLSVDNGKIRIESRATFFDTSNPIDLGIVKNHEQSYAADMVGNVLKVGHTKPDIEDVNGKFDPNGSSVFTLPITRVAKEINLIGPYKKGPYEIEITRINLDGKTTTDNNNDNDCFVIHVKENAETFTNVSGTTDGLNLITLTGMAADIAIFQSVMAFYVSALGITVLHRIESVTVNGADLDIITVDDVAGTGAFSGYTISFPYTLNREAVVDPAAEVCPSPATIFNVIFTPKNILKLHGRWLRSVLMGFDAEKIKFQSGDKNTKFKAVVNGVTIDEDTDEDISLLGDRLFYPIYHDFETLVPVNLVELMETNPNRCFRFTDADTGEVFTGFNIKSGLAPNTLQPQQFKLLSTPLNDLTKLIY